jgi:excisionase family DNA binding protein
MTDLSGSFLTRKQVMSFFNIGRTKVDQLVASGELDSYKDGSSRRITLESCRARVERLKTTPKPVKKSRWSL